MVLKSVIAILKGNEGAFSQVNVDFFFIRLDEEEMLRKLGSSEGHFKQIKKGQGGNDRLFDGEGFWERAVHGFAHVKKLAYHRMCLKSYGEERSHILT